MSTESHLDDPSLRAPLADDGPSAVAPASCALPAPATSADGSTAELAAALIERLAGPVLLLSTSGRLIAANRAARGLLGASEATRYHASPETPAQALSSATAQDPSGLLDFGPSGLPAVAAPVPAEAVVAAVVAYASRPVAGTRRITARIRHGEHAGAEVAATMEPLTGTDGRPLAALLQFDLAAPASEPCAPGPSLPTAPGTAPAVRAPILRSAASPRPAGASTDSDPLTGLPRRLQAERQLALAVEKARNDGGALVLFRARLSGLPSVRGLHGREAADEVVRTIAQRLSAALRGGDLVARMDVDEFVIAATLREESDAAPVAAKVERALGAPIRVEHGIASVRPCVGAALWPRDGQTHDALLARAALVGKLSGR